LNIDHSMPASPGVISLPPISALELLEMDIKPPECILGPWLRERTLALLYAPRGVGKSYFAMSCGYAIAMGSSFLRWQAPASVPVLYVDGEMPKSELQSRLDGMVNGDHDNDMAPENLYFLPAEHYEGGIPDIARPAGQAAIQEALDSIGNSDAPRLLILDNLSTLSGAKENEGDEWLPIGRFLLKLRAANVAVLVVHHAGRNGQARGTSRREDAMDTVVHLRHPEDYEPDQGARFELLFEKSRSFTGKDAAPLEAKLIVGENGAISWEYSSPTNKKWQAMEMFANGKEPKDVEVALGVSRAASFNWRKEFRGA
jgi:RecA-family ATPase